MPSFICIDKELNRRFSAWKAIKPENNSTKRFVSRWSQHLRLSVSTRSSTKDFLASSTTLSVHCTGNLLLVFKNVVKWISSLKKLLFILAICNFFLWHVIYKIYRDIWILRLMNSWNSPTYTFFIVVKSWVKLGFSGCQQASQWIQLNLFGKHGYLYLTLIIVFPGSQQVLQFI